MQCIVDVQRLRWVRNACHSLTTLFEDFRDRYRTPESIFLELNGSRLDTQQFPDNAGQDGGRASRLPTRDRSDRLLLFGGRLFINDESN